MQQRADCCFENQITVEYFVVCASRCTFRSGSEARGWFISSMAVKCTRLGYGWSVCTYVCVLPVCVCSSWYAVVTFPLCSNSTDVRALVFFLSCIFWCCWLTDALPVLCPPVNSLARSKYCWRPIRRRKRTRLCPTRTLLWARTRPLHPTGPLSLVPHSPLALLTLVPHPSEGRRMGVEGVWDGEGKKRRLGGKGRGWGCVSCCRLGGWVSGPWGSTWPSLCPHFLCVSGIHNTPHTHHTPRTLNHHAHALPLLHPLLPRAPLWKPLGRESLRHLFGSRPILPPWPLRTGWDTEPPVTAAHVIGPPGVWTAPMPWWRPTAHPQTAVFPSGRRWPARTTATVASPPRDTAAPSTPTDVSVKRPSWLSWIPFIKPVYRRGGQVRQRAHVRAHTQTQRTSMQIYSKLHESFRYKSLKNVHRAEDSINYADDFQQVHYVAHLSTNSANISWLGLLPFTKKR